MKINIQYESERLLPNDIEKQIEVMQERILNNHLEGDKIICFIGNFKYTLINWIHDNAKIINEEK